MGSSPTTVGMRETKNQPEGTPTLSRSNRSTTQELQTNYFTDWQLAASAQSQAKRPHQFQEAVFLGGEIIAPAYDSRYLLLQAGDIEVNPGPATRPRSSSTV